MKTLKQINHNLKKYVIEQDYSYEPGEEFGYQELDVRDEVDRQKFLEGLSHVHLPFVSIMGERSSVDLGDISSLSEFAMQNEINLQLYLEDSCYSDICLELLEFTKDYIHTPCKELNKFYDNFENLDNKSVAMDSIIIKNPLLDLDDLLALNGFCYLYDFDMTIYSMYDEDNEEDEENNQITIEFTKK